MSFGSRLNFGARLIRDSALLVRHNPRLLLFPVLSVVMLTSLLGAMMGYAIVVAEATSVGLVLIFGCWVFLGFFISLLFTAGLVHQTHAIITDDVSPSIRDGFAAAWRRKRTLFLWMLVVVSINFIIEAIEDIDSGAMSATGFVLDVAWSVATFFVVPVIILEHVGITTAFTRSSDIFRDLWGETAIGFIGVELIMLVFVGPVAVMGLYYMYVIPTLGVFILGIAAVYGYILHSTFQAIIKTALYVYVTDNEPPEEFANIHFDNLEPMPERYETYESSPYN